jgi:hypothetical protein
MVYRAGVRQRNEYEMIRRLRVLSSQLAKGRAIRERPAAFRPDVTLSKAPLDNWWRLKVLPGIAGKATAGPDKQSD